MRLEELASGMRITGVLGDEVVTVVFPQWHGPESVELTYKRVNGDVKQQMLFRDDEARLARSDVGSRPFDADGLEFRLVAEAQRVRLAGLFDPMLAVATSDVQPLPHQITAVYGEMLDRVPLRFLLADDPGAGKTIMAGLYLKELMLRGDVQKCLIVAPGGLVDQWQDELLLKFGIRFEVLNPGMAEASMGSNLFERNPLLIARMDQLTRNETLRAHLADAHFDLVVVDEAHRMGAHYYGAKPDKTKRFLLGEELRDRARHLLLMTATPHAGKDDDFQLFLTLLDRDGFEGKFRAGVHKRDTSGLMRRMVKEDLLTFEGKRLFPERFATTLHYRLSPDEDGLYQQVTDYVRQGMNRAERLDPRRRNTVGFALTVLQRRLASSPEAIYSSLVRRRDRLQRRREDLLAGRGVAAESTLGIDVDGWDDDEHAAAEIEQVEEELLDAATAARTVEELALEIVDLERLVLAARRVRDLDTDRKWVKLREIFEENDLIGLGPGASTVRRKIIVFTEHRDTLNYLARKITGLLGRPEAVRQIHGGVGRDERRAVTTEFTTNPNCQVLLATDAAGEGLNLQAAHLLVNYDLPWNPNRIEQRFGRVHRIGQEYPCRLWNLVAENTREGLVFTRLLAKVDEQRKAYGGKVFDVLGAAMGEASLRDLLIDAIRYGELPETREKMEQVIDVSFVGEVQELLRRNALAEEVLSESELGALRRQMEEARARRLQPHYVERAFRDAFTRLGGRLSRREAGRFEITHVPAQVRAVTRFGPVSTRYERVTFDLAAVTVAGAARADLLAPGHPLHDSVLETTVEALGNVLDRGTVLVSPELEESALLVGVVEEIVDGEGASIARRFHYAYANSSGQVADAGPAPYLDCVSAPAGPVVDAARKASWLNGAEAAARSWIIEHQVQDYLGEVAPRRLRDIERMRERVDQRLTQEANRLAGEATVAQQREQAGERPRETSDSLMRKAEELAVRRERRLTQLGRQAQLSAKPPQVVTAALVLPLKVIEGELPLEAPIHARETKAVERRGVEAVLAAERALGRTPVEQPFTNPGYDVRSYPPGDGPSVMIEVKARLEGAEDFFVTANEVLHGKNAAPDYRLALVSVSPLGAEHDVVRYVGEPFTGTELGANANGVRMVWSKTWGAGRSPW